MTRTGIGLSEGPIIRIRVTDEQKENFKKAASQEGMELSPWLRQLGIKRAQKVNGK